MTRPILLLVATGALAHSDVVVSYGESSPAEVVPVPALHVEAGQSPTPFLEPGPFTVTWKGQLTVPTRQRLFFTFDGEGTAALKIGGELVHEESGTLGATKSERTRLNAGEHEVEITYQSKDDGSGRFRLLWEERSFPIEPVPPTAWQPLAEQPDLAAAHGRTAFAQHRCIKCHAPESGFNEGSMPELAASGPNLTGIGSRVSEEWLVRWIAEPDKLKPTTTMPAMVDHTTAEGAQQAADLGAYLATLKVDATPAPTPVTDEAVQAGGAHFHQLGCVACHTPPGVDVPDRANSRIPLNNVATKFADGRLADFLLNPRRHNPWIKMPDFQLSEDEARQLAAFLRKESTGRHTPDPSEFPPGDAARGKELAATLSCAACHEGLPAGTTSAPGLGDLAQLDDWTAKGCLAPDEQRGSAPRLILGKDTADHVAAFAKGHLDSLSRSTPAHYARRQIEALNCRACHSDAETPSLLATLHPESKKFIAHLEDGEHGVDQSRPQLAFMGEMLTTSFMEKILRGEAEPRPRPWLHMRMPAFPQHASMLAHGLSQQHGLAPTTADDSPRDAEKAEVGKMIVGVQGLACVTCHGAGEMQPLAAFEVMGINFAQVHERLLPEFFQRWLRNPRRIQPDSKMPAYTTEDGGALRQDILEGDPQKQFEAVWEYLKAGPKVEHP